jgi:hypothetical protein
VCKYLEIRPSPDRSPPCPSVEKHSRLWRLTGYISIFESKYNIYFGGSFSHSLRNQVSDRSNEVVHRPILSLDVYSKFYYFK